MLKCFNVSEKLTVTVYFRLSNNSTKNRVVYTFETEAQGQNVNNKWPHTRLQCLFLSAIFHLFENTSAKRNHETKFKISTYQFLKWLIDRYTRFVKINMTEAFV